MSKFFSNYKIIFYSFNFFLVLLYLFPGSLPGLIIYGDKQIQPQITPDFSVSSNHVYVFVLVSAVGFLTFRNKNQTKNLIIYLLLLSFNTLSILLKKIDSSFPWLFFIDLFSRPRLDRFRKIFPHSNKVLFSIIVFKPFLLASI